MIEAYIDSNHASADLYKLNRAVFDNKYQIVEEILGDVPELINTIIKPIYESPLANALKRKEIDYRMLEILVQHGVSFNYPINHHRMLPLELGAKMRNRGLCEFLITHQAAVTPLVAHYLLANTSNIDYLTLKGIQTAYQIIKLLGGLEMVCNMKDEEGLSFKSNAMQCMLINSSGGTLAYDFLELLKLEEAADLGRTPAIKMGYKNSLKERIESISQHYRDKAKIDEQTLRHSIDYSFFTGADIIPQRKVVRHDNSEGSLKIR